MAQDEEEGWVGARYGMQEEERGFAKAGFVLPATHCQVAAHSDSLEHDRSLPNCTPS